MTATANQYGACPGLRYSIRGVKELYSKTTCRSGSSGLDRRIWPNNFSLRFNQIWENRWIDKWCVSRKTSSTLWFGKERSMKEGGIFNMRRRLFIWKELILSRSGCVSWMHSSPYKTLLRRIESKTRNFQRMVVLALSQNSFILLQVVSAAANLLLTSRWLFTLSESKVPKYVASLLRVDRCAIQIFDTGLSLVESQINTFVVIQFQIVVSLIPFVFRAKVC